MKFNIKIQPSGIEFEASTEQSILQSALDAGFHLEYSCKDGRCGKCKVKIINGAVERQEKFSSSITLKEINDGYLLSCMTKPSSNLELEARYFSELKDIKTTIEPCKVNSLEFPTTETVIIKLNLSKSSDFRFLAGQYIDLIIQGHRRSYSIANATNRIKSDGIELHIRKVTNGIFSEIIFNELKVNHLLRIEGPHGTFFIRDNTRPLIFVAGGSGFAPVKAMVEELISKDSKRKIMIYWGVEFHEQFYSKLPIEWQQQYNNIKYIPVVSGNDEAWIGKKGLVHKSVISDISELSKFDVYACGSPVMIDVAKKEFIECGMLQENFYSDAFISSN